MKKPQNQTYRQAGVDIDAGRALVERIKSAARATKGPGVIGGIGGFAGLFELPLADYREPVLVAGADGVGTKLKLAIAMNQHHGIGVDLVAMCVNDILVAGARPLFFLDYYAAGELNVQQAMRVINGIADGCRQANCALIGGESAEMPGIYAAGDYDLAGFAVGIVEKSEILPKRVKPGDVVLGLASSGAHANGYSLIRQIIADRNADLCDNFERTTLGEALLAPTRIYVKSILALQKNIQPTALCHITGGGLHENLPRVLPQDTRAKIDLRAWQRPPIFTWLQTQGDIEETEMLRTFNCGIGMTLCVAKEQAAAAAQCLQSAGERVFTIGEIQRGDGAPSVEFVFDSN